MRNIYPEHSYVEASEKAVIQTLFKIRQEITNMEQENEELPNLFIVIAFNKCGRNQHFTDDGVQ